MSATSPGAIIYPRRMPNLNWMARAASNRTRHLCIISMRDALGRLIHNSIDDSVTEYDYDALGQLLSEANSAGELKYAYDELGNLETLTLPDQRQLNHLYYGSGHLHQITLGGRVISDFERD